MKNNIIAKTLAIFLSTTALLQVSGIPSKLVNGNNIVQASATEKKYQVVYSISIEGDLVEGQTLKVVIKNKAGEDITESLDPTWYRIDNPISENYQYLSENDNKYRYSLEQSGDNGNTYKLEKEDIGKYIGVKVLGEDPDGHTTFGFVDLVTTLKSTATKVEPNPLIHWQKEIVDYKGDKSTKWYYLNEDGSKFTGWKEIGGNWYYFNPKRNGEMAIYWKEINGSWYFFKPSSGKMLTGWVKYKAWNEKEYKYYYLYNNGVMATNTTIDGHYVNSSGASTDAIDKSLLKN
jgi:hypothetical protein